MAMPSSISSSQWADILQNVFITVHRLNLSETHRWVLSSYFPGRSWLRSLYLSPARDPEAALLETFALRQYDQSLLPLWTRLCRLEDDLPLHYASLGLLGLRKLPDKDGKPPGDLHPIVFKGIVDLAEAINLQYKPHKIKQEEPFWLLECRAIMALYPRSLQYWVDNFFPIIHEKPESPAVKWLGKVIPGLQKKMESHTNGKRPVLQPSPYERENILGLLKEKTIDDIKVQLASFLEKHRRYAYQTGYSEHLVKIFCNIGNKIFEQDSEMALTLVEEAFLWEPCNPYTWTERAKIEAYRGNYQKSIAILWEAKRRFPENPYIRTILANTLKKYGEDKTAEIIYRQAIIDFPHNEVCRTGLAEVLKAQNRLEEAEAVYHQAIIDFPHEEVCRTGLAEVLKAQNRLEEAEAVYRQAIVDFPESVFCHTGLAGILLQQRKRKEAIDLLEKTIKRFPYNKVAKKFLEKIHAGEALPDIQIVHREELMKNSPEFQKTELMQKPSEKVFLLLETKSVFEKEKQRKEHVPEKTSEETKSPISAISGPPEGNSLEVETGMANLYRLASRMVSEEEKEEYRRKAFSMLTAALNRMPDNIPALLENGWLLLDVKPKEAVGFFSLQLSRHPHLLGLHLGSLRFKSTKGERVERTQWDNMINSFSRNTTVIKLEHTMHELANGNGNKLAVLENLRKQLIRDMKQLPAFIQENEKWVVSVVKQSLFKDIKVEDSLTEDKLPHILDNHRKHENLLKGVVEQCASAV
ncbi:TPA: tetratricopeptide repeat protein [Candidatus Woesearchaeota archaeon]|nr:tetratricopeptide repeat protein [Candidatus Woesearchaeota archaeon]